jgi:hypothetical protein
MIGWFGNYIVYEYEKKEFNFTRRFAVTEGSL